MITIFKSVFVATIILFFNGPVYAITDGELDGGNHPAVVLILMEVAGVPAYRCSGVLIAPTFVLTAGHCTGAPGEFSGLRVFTEADVDNGDNNYPDAGPNSIEAIRWESHPGYPYAPFYVNDVGVIELAKDVNLSIDRYASLPSANLLDSLARQRGLKDVTFTAVGYGLQKINPVFIEADRVRMVAYPNLVQINVPGLVNDYSLLLSNNHSTGGTCFGDSGGPNFIGSSLVVGGVTSFGLNGNCAGTGGVFRIDRQNVLDFINRFTGS